MASALAIGGVTLAPDTPRIVAAGSAAELDALARANGAHLVELRADLSPDASPAALPALLARLRAAGRPVILTVRAAAEGGGGPLPDDLRRALYLAGLPHADAIDVEIAADALVAELVPKARAKGATVILSVHHLERTPALATLVGHVDRAQTLGAAITKIAALARSVDDVRTLLEATLATRERNVVTLPMGPLGAARVLFPFAGSLLTYAHVGRPTAPSGQLALPELLALMGRLYP